MSARTPKLLLSLSIVLLCLPARAGIFPGKQPKKSSAELRADYLADVVQAVVPSPATRSTGSLWSPDGLLVDAPGDYKAHTLNDIVTVIASVQTTAAQSGTVDSARNFGTSSGITGLAGVASTSKLSSLFNAQSATTLKGAGQTASNTAFSTSLSGQVIALLPNGNMVIEAHQQIDFNNQHEEVIVRGIARPGDITPLNTIASSSLSALQIELQGKGIISDSVRPPNPLTRAVLWLFGF